ncbi:lysophospholipid acyltransferase family protein [Persicimonas caeni]|nr:lysophospholipid acyltransferase family protein [Persicimonas caeni]
MGLTQPIKRLRERIDETLVDTIDPSIWANIQNMEAGQNEYGFDPFGFEPDFLKYIVPVAERLYRKYFRTEVVDIENIPDSGRVLLVANHTGQIPIDGFLLGCALLFDKKPARMVRSMVEHWVPTIPFVSWFLARAGQVVGTRENCRILLGRDGCILVFPEGIRGINKTYDRAYELERFGLGFMRLALETNTPIVPVGVVGGEEQMPSIWNFESLGKLLGMPAFPITPTWPLLGPLGALPLPVKYRLYFGEPMHFEGAPDDEDRVINAQVDRVKDALRELIDRGLDEREGVFW